MTHEQLIAKARAHMKPFDRSNAFGVSSDIFTEARVQEAALVVLGSGQRDDYVEVYLDRETGAFISATYHPGAAEKPTSDDL